MSMLAKLIAAVEKIQINENISTDKLIHDLETLLNHFKMREKYETHKKHLADYVDNPWF